MKIVVCMGSSCFSRGNGENLAAIRTWLAAHDLSTDAVDLRGCRCGEACHSGPNIWIDDVCYSNVTPDAIDGLLTRLLKEGVDE